MNKFRAIINIDRTRGAQPKGTNSFISKLLDINFFKYIDAENRRDKCKMMIKNAPPIDIDYKNLLRGFELRHKVVHELSEVPYSYTHILKLWDNAMNIFDISNTIFISAKMLKQFRLRYGRNPKAKSDES